MYWYTGGNKILATVLYIFFIGLIIISLISKGKRTLKGYVNILKTPGIGGTDYVKTEGFYVSGFNMGINGLLATTFVLLVGGDLNGPTIGGIMTVVGFGTTGKHLRNILPVMVGVLLASLPTTWTITTPGPMLALLFCTTLAPVAGEFGIIPGVIAGILHFAVVMNVGTVYAGMILYNNGFAGGLVAIFMVPFLNSIRDRRARARGHLSL